MHTRRRRLARTAALVAGAAVAAGLSVPAASATPVRGNTGWSVLLCKFSDKAAEPQTPDFFRRFATTAGNGQGGLADYWRQVSMGAVTLDGSQVQGWYRMPFTLAQEAPKSRGQKIQDCVDTAARNGYSVPPGYRTMAIINDQVDSGSAGGRVLLDPGAWNIRFAAHEMGHGYGLDHTFSNDLSYRNASWSQPGEYDDEWDEMSAQHVHGFGTASFGNGGVGMAAPTLDELGSLPRNRVTTVGADGVSSRSYTLAPLESPGTPGALMLRVPFDPGDLFHYYTVEFRRQLGWSRGIPGDTVLIHEVKNGTATLQRQLGTPSRSPMQSLSANGVAITTTALAGGQAQVTVTTGMPTRCLQGFVWRDARPGDTVCVTGATRSQAAYDNAVASRRWVDGPYGPQTCINGYVWREAFAGDKVCVLPAVRAQASADNAAAGTRSNPARFVLGPNVCKPGYVWRDGDLRDYVCVSGAVRAQTAYDNRVAPYRWVNGPYGPQTCRQGYVWREAWQTDRVCVTPAVRAQARADNAQVPNRVLRPLG